MKREKSHRNYYDEFLEVCSFVSRASRLTDIRKLVKNEHPGSNISLPFGTCLIDYSTQEYKYISENCQDIISYSKDEYIEGGLNAHVIHFHPDDLVIYTQQVFRDIQEFWNRIDPNEISKYRVSFNQRHFRKDGTIAQLVQHAIYLEPQNSGMPALNLTTFSDISDFKADTSMVLSISRFVSDEGYVKVFSKSYPQPGNTVLSKRELEVLKLCIDGLTSKMIADKLFLSVQTVKNHKRNMMAKTSARNIAALISLSLMNNWIF
jgi:DNA-binding CsgD family transcriptional regulator